MFPCGITVGADVANTEKKLSFASLIDVSVPILQVTGEIPVFSVTVLAHLDYLGPRALKEIEVSEQWSCANETVVIIATKCLVSLPKNHQGYDVKMALCWKVLRNLFLTF